MTADQLYRIDYLPLIKKDFPLERFGVADKYLLRRCVQQNYKIFRKHDAPCGHVAFVVAVLKDMENYGYNSRLEDLLEKKPIEGKLKLPLDGD